MTQVESLLELVRQVRAGTLKLLEVVPEPWLTWAPPGTSNHILWHAGHALWLQDVLAIEPITGHGELPDGWSETFGMRCRPLSQTTSWPSRDELFVLLVRQRERLLELIASLPRERLVIPTPRPSTGWDLVRGIVHGLHDEAKHQGEAYLLFKLCRARTQG